MPLGIGLLLKLVKCTCAIVLVKDRFQVSCVSFGMFRKSSKKGEKGTKAKVTVKYSAAKLHEKGVVLEIEGLPTSQ